MTEKHTTTIYATKLSIKESEILYLWDTFRCDIIDNVLWHGETCRCYVANVTLVPSQQSHQ